MKELIEIQNKLKAPKGQYNSFGKYKYRNCEDILEAVKPILKEHGCFLVISDDIIQVGERIYVKATATLKNESGEMVSVSASAREEETKKGMDASQITGAASSYARKYALNGLFCIDDTKDADSDNKSSETNNSHDILSIAIQEVNSAKTVDVLKQIWENYPTLQSNTQFVSVMNNRKKLCA